MENYFSMKGVSCWLRWFLPIAILVTKSDVVMGEGSSSSSRHDCSLYLAKSTIPNAGLGVFAAQDFRIGDVIGNPSIGIPVVDFLHPGFPLLPQSIARPRLMLPVFGMACSGFLFFLSVTEATNLGLVLMLRSFVCLGVALSASDFLHLGLPRPG